MSLPCVRWISTRIPVTNTSVYHSFYTQLLMWNCLKCHIWLDCHFLFSDCQCGNSCWQQLWLIQVQPRPHNSAHFSLSHFYFYTRERSMMLQDVGENLLLWFLTIKRKKLRWARQNVNIIVLWLVHVSHPELTWVPRIAYVDSISPIGWSGWLQVLLSVNPAVKM